jgi:uncharacterized membrane protein YeaQ/YmgE (transglycosylase-associated protein family)
MTVFTWLLAGGLIGWAASRYVSNTGPEAIAFNVAVAVLGSSFVGWVVAPMLGVPPGFGVFAFLVSALGAAALLFCAHFVQQATAR